jgi:hypothetical protein
MRKERGWSAARLAEECARLGYPEITDQVIYNLEQRRREEVTVDQLVAFSEALAMPVELLLGPKKRDSYVLTFESEAERRAFGEALETIRSGIALLPGYEQEGT